MSKLSKFFSLGIDILKSEAGKEKLNLDASIMEDTLNRVEEYLNSKGLSYKEKEEPVAGEVNVSVKCRNKGIISELRFYPVDSFETFETEFKPSGAINVLRFVTDENGSLKEKLPAGKYIVRASKGSEYVPAYNEITVKEGDVAFTELEISQFIDLHSEGYIAGDIHHHSIYSSPVWGGTDPVVESPKEVSDSMRAMGLRYGALSDHHNVLNHENWKACKTDDFFPVPSKEISTSNGHVLSLGVDGYDVIYNIPDDKDRTEEYLRGEFVRITDEIREKGGLPQLNHPRDLSKAISWNPKFYDMTGVFETIEIWNGSNPMYYGSTNAMAADFWRSLLEKGQYIPITTGSDTHNIKADDYHKMYSKMLWLKENVETILGDEEARLLFTNDYDTLSSFLEICKKYLPMLEVWANTSLTSGCVRTYIKLEGEPTKEKILDALRHGHSFLTNGPVLTASVNGKGMGESVEVKNGKADVSIRLLSTRKLTKLYAYLSKMRAVEIPLKENQTAPIYDYSIDLKDFDVKDSSYIFFVAASDITNLAITNPVLLL